MIASASSRVRHGFLQDDVLSLACGPECQLPVIGNREAHVHDVYILRRDQLLVRGVGVRPDYGGTCCDGLGTGVRDAHHLHLGHLGVGVQVDGAYEPCAYDTNLHPSSSMIAVRLSEIS